MFVISVLSVLRNNEPYGRYTHGRYYKNLTKMTSDCLARHGVIIGVVTMLASLPIFLNEISKSRFIVDPEESKYYMYPENVFTRLFYITVPFLVFIASCLLIFGIVKKQHLLLTPWLTLGILISLYFIAYWITSLRISFNSLFDMFTSFVILLGAQIIALYPIGHLYLKLRREKYVHNIQCV